VRRGFVAASFIDQSNSKSAFIELEKLLVVLLYEDEVCGRCKSRQKRVPLRLAAYGASRVPHGIQWGGAANCRFFKDLMLTPRLRARGQRIDRSKVELLSLALKLNYRLGRAARHPAAPWRALRLPRVWAGFRQHDAGSLLGDGPEFDDACRQSGLSANALFQSAARRIFGLVLFPMNWVSNQFERAVAVFAEVTPSLRRQTYRIEGIPDSLIGYQGASAFDFYNSRYRNGRREDTIFRKAEKHKLPVPQTDVGAAQLTQAVGYVA
jgi:hypothetical protein